MFAFSFPFGWYGNVWAPWATPASWLNPWYARAVRAMFGLPW